MLKGLRFRIYPNKTQQKLIQQTFGCCRYVYNQGLAFRINQYECGNPIGYNETNKLLYKLKHEGRLKAVLPMSKLMGFPPKIYDNE